MTNKNKIKVLIIDDSALIRQSISLLLKDSVFIDVVGTSYNPFDAIQKIQKLKPDVLLLDIQMPEMDGLTFLKKLMKQQPMPVIIFSSFVEEGSTNALKALEYGAVEIIGKPKFTTSAELEKYKLKLIGAVQIASIANIKSKNNVLQQEIIKEEIKTVSYKSPSISFDSNFIIAIGASTGGTEAIKRVLETVPEDFPPIVITQHMPVGFTNSFANRLNQICKITVKEAETNDILETGHAYIARGDRQLIVKKVGEKHFLKLEDTPPVNRHKPSVDVLFNSVAKTYGKNSIGVILTGMGSDGAKGLKTMKETGAHTIAQDESSCVVFGMPKVAISIGGVDVVLPIYQITDYLIKTLSKNLI
ncbi:MAG: chemotaxis response regulator protein-glutamate methylesterase [Bacteroidales bacterium]|nr:chemotaxis response regulator protein-glutamate methylesterase [Bacteroidales bacterium]